jgi:hypothetical protein
MPAHVVEGTHDVVGASDHDEVVLADVRSEVVAGVRDRCVDADEHPFTVPDGVEVDLMKRRIDIEAAGE